MSAIDQAVAKLVDEAEPPVDFGGPSVFEELAELLDQTFAALEDPDSGFNEYMGQAEEAVEELTDGPHGLTKLADRWVALNRNAIALGDALSVLAREVREGHFYERR